MSSTLLAAKHFNSVENSLKEFSYSSENTFPYSFKEIFPALYRKSECSFDKTDAVIASIMQTVRSLSALCVTYQYPEGDEQKMNFVIEQTLLELRRDKKYNSLNNIELFKAISAVNYQIEPEHLQERRPLTEDENNALFFLKEMKAHLSLLIVLNLDAYDKAEWFIA